MSHPGTTHAPMRHHFPHSLATGVLAAVVALVTAVVVMLAAAPSAHGASAASTPAGRCVLTLTVTEDLLTPARAAARTWNVHTTTLEDYPFRIRVRAGDVIYRGGELRALDGTDGLAAMTMTSAQIRDLTTEDIVGAGGLDLAGFALDADALRALGSDALVDTATAHLLGHALNIPHDRDGHALMSEYPITGTTTISEESRQALQVNADLHHLLWC